MNRCVSFVKGMGAALVGMLCVHLADSGVAPRSKFDGFMMGTIALICLYLFVGYSVNAVFGELGDD